MKNFFTILMLIVSGALQSVHGQELFVYTEPASNMPAKSAGLRVSNWIMQQQNSDSINYHLIPELMWGVNKRLMLHAEAFMSNRNGGMSVEGGAFYAKYRFFSKDKVYRHFRSAAFIRSAINNSRIHQEEIETNGHNSGCEIGLIGTQLLHKQAVSTTISAEHIWGNANNNEIPLSQSWTAVNYTLSTGRLILPKDYTNYGQTNLNIMVECLGQYLPENGRSFLDAAAALQLIFNSQTRVDIAYKRMIYSTMSRTAPNGLLIRVEHLLFNAFK